MPRSLKKGPYIDPKLEKKVKEMGKGSKKTVIKTWSRRSTILPQFVGLTFGVYNGKKFVPVLISLAFIGGAYYGYTASTVNFEKMYESLFLVLGCLFAAMFILNLKMIILLNLYKKKSTFYMYLFL